MQPAAVILLEQIPHDVAAGGLISIDPDKLGALVRGSHSALGQKASGVIGLFVVGALKRFPYLLLALVIRIDRECHQLIESHAVLGIDVEELRRDRGELEPLLDDLDTDEKNRRDLLLAHAFLAQIAERTELIERVQRRALDVLGERILFSQTCRPHNARDRRGTRKPLLLDQELKRPITPSARRNFEHAGFRALVVKNRPHGETLKERAPSDILARAPRSRRPL